MIALIIVSIVAVLVISATIWKAKREYELTWGNKILIGIIISASLMGVTWAYRAFISPDCGCMNVIFRITEVALIIGVLWELWELINPLVVLINVTMLLIAAGLVYAGLLADNTLIISALVSAGVALAVESIGVLLWAIIQERK